MSKMTDDHLLPTTTENYRVAVKKKLIDASDLKGLLDCAWFQASGMPDRQALAGTMIKQQSNWKRANLWNSQRSDYKDKNFK